MKFRLMIFFMFFVLVTYECDALKIVSTAPNVTEILISLGLKDSIYGITDFCPKPNSYAVSIGNISIDAEKLMMIEPDIVFVIKGFSSNIEQFVKKGLVSLEFDSVHDIINSVNRMIQVTGTKKGSGFVKSLESLKPFSARKRKTFIQIWENPCITVGNKSYISDFLDRLGLENIYRDVNRSFFEVNFEDLLQRNPEIIIVSQDIPFSMAYYSGSILRFIDAVKNEKIIIIPPDVLLRPGPGLMNAVKILKDRLDNEK